MVFNHHQSYLDNVPKLDLLELVIGRHMQLIQEIILLRLVVEIFFHVPAQRLSQNEQEIREIRYVH